MSTKHRLCRLDDIAPGTAQRFPLGGTHIAVVRIDDDVYAIGDTCSHQKISLSEGDIPPENKSLECWKHGSEFSLETGEAVTLPATKAVPTYDVRVEDGEIIVVEE